ncbi:hypothetical protein THASP1DRAFT_30795 [Thamnocephalis sphaerospora]|uniref:Uncharacterized protein n=1 Tax=Thamnocephalis sphaerospora TaxID=78915 RepID=A0A4P9XN89_9FUNG|nr:hypothetical protein THASP1DRAFT_30795 [Thamnocephalis sphaerospora]|eukprot:RKP07386.1 hypothetical protein THASP1DRAFT_30795 [Thamnocephalis sphaerospora]
MASPLQTRVFSNFISPFGDVVFSVAVGVFAYTLYERDHPREPGFTLRELAGRWMSARSASLRSRIAVHDPEDDEV